MQSKDLVALNQSIRAVDVSDDSIVEHLASYLLSPNERRALGWSALRAKRQSLATRIWDQLDDAILSVNGDCALGRTLAEAAAADSDLATLRWAIRRGVRTFDLIEVTSGGCSLEVVKLVAERVREDGGGKLDTPAGWQLLRSVVSSGNAAAAQLLVLGMGVSLASPPRRTVVYDEDGDRFITTIPGDTSAINLLAGAGLAGTIAALARTERGKALLANPDLRASHEKGLLAAAVRGYEDVLEVLVEQCGVDAQASHPLLGTVDAWPHDLSSAAVAHALLPPPGRVAAGAAELACARRMLLFARDHGAAMEATVEPRGESRAAGATTSPPVGSSCSGSPALATALAAWKRAIRDFSSADLSSPGFRGPHLHEVVSMVLELGAPVPTAPAFWGPKYALPIAPALAAAVVDGIGRKMWSRRRAAVLSRAAAGAAASAIR